LRYIVDRSLSGQNQELKERVIGIEVFGRSPDYDTSTDPTVRVAANEVRKRLENYYLKAGSTQEVRIEIPVGSYIAEFTEAELVPSKPRPEVPQPMPAEKQHRPRGRNALIFSAVIIVLLIAGAGTRLLLTESAMDRFWAPILSHPGPVLVCINSRRLADTPESAALPYAGPDRNVSTGTVGLNAINDLSGYLERRSKRFTIRASEVVTMDDLRAQPSILYGSFNDKWSLMLASSLRFHFREIASPGFQWIEDSNNPSNKAWSLDKTDITRQVGSDYALITRAQDPTTGQWWIGIAGLTGQATLAANRFFLDPVSVSRLAAGLPKDWDKKNLQMVLDVKTVQGSAGVPRIVASYSW
jgi:hypothetical protein